MGVSSHEVLDLPVLVDARTLPQSMHGGSNNLPAVSALAVRPLDGFQLMFSPKSTCRNMRIDAFFLWTERVDHIFEDVLIEFIDITIKSALSISKDLTPTSGNGEHE